MKKLRVKGENRRDCFLYFEKGDEENRFFTFEFVFSIINRDYAKAFSKLNFHNGLFSWMQKKFEPLKSFSMRFLFTQGNFSNKTNDAIFLVESIYDSALYALIFTQGTRGIGIRT